VDRFDIEGQVAVITGGNGLLGSEYALTLAKAGVRVAVFDISGELNDRLKEESGGDEGSIKLFPTDITSKDEVKRSLAKVIDWAGVPSILINNAAIDFPPGAYPDDNRSFENYPLEAWKASLDVTLTGAMICSQVIGCRMAQEGKGSIINISSTLGLVSPDQRIYASQEEKTGIPFVKPISYTVTKAGMIGMTKWLATYFAKDGVRVNTLVPGGVFNNQDDEFVEEYEKKTPLGRMARRDEYNKAILFLASDDSSYMTGAELVIDGGWTAW